MTACSLKDGSQAIACIERATDAWGPVVLKSDAWAWFFESRHAICMAYHNKYSLPSCVQRNHKITFKWYFFCKDCRTRPVYIPHIHHANKRPSQMRNDVLGSTPWKTAVAVARAIPPSIHTAWHMHGVVQGVSSLKLSTLRPNKTHGQNRPVQPVKSRRQGLFT